MIYTLTLNPAIDYVVHADNFQIGAISRSQSENIYFGGKGINVSLILNELGIQSTALGFVAGFTGNALKAGIESKSIKTDFIEVKDGLTRINVKIRSEKETDINCNGPKISLKDIDLLLEKLNTLKSGDWLVLAGSVPNTLPQSIYQSILSKLQGKSINFVVDAENKLLLNTLQYKPFLVKPNREELSEMFGVSIEGYDDIVLYAKKLQQMGAENVLVSLGSDGAVLVTHNGKEYYEKAPTVKTVNTVGAGDSMLAGFIAGYLEKSDFSYALRLGSAAGSATAASEGLASREGIIEIF